MPGHSELEPRLELQRYNSTSAIELAHRVWPCYDEVFGDFDDFQTWSDDLFTRHATRNGYRLIVASEGEAVAGFSWGYIGERGQYWTDLVCDALPATVTDEWVGGHFEFVELAVAPKYRRRGLGRRLHDALLDGVPQQALLSTTDDLADPAVQLYLSSGWRKLGLLRPGTQVMGHGVPGRSNALDSPSSPSPRPTGRTDTKVIVETSGRGLPPTAHDDPCGGKTPPRKAHDPGSRGPDHVDSDCGAVLVFAL